MQDVTTKDISRHRSHGLDLLFCRTTKPGKVCLEYHIQYLILVLALICTGGQYSEAAGYAIIFKDSPDSFYRYELHWVASTFHGAMANCQSRAGGEGVLTPLATEEEVATVAALLGLGCCSKDGWGDEYFFVGLTTLEHPHSLGFLDRPRPGSSTTLLQNITAPGQGLTNGSWPDSPTSPGAGTAATQAGGDTLPQPLCGTIRLLLQAAVGAAVALDPAPVPSPQTRTAACAPTAGSLACNTAAARRLEVNFHACDDDRPTDRPSGTGKPAQRAFICRIPGPGRKQPPTPPSPPLPQLPLPPQHPQLPLPPQHPQLPLPPQHPRPPPRPANVLTPPLQPSPEFYAPPAQEPSEPQPAAPPNPKPPAVPADSRYPRAPPQPLPGLERLPAPAPAPRSSAAPSQAEAAEGDPPSAPPPSTTPAPALQMTPQPSAQRTAPPPPPTLTLPSQGLPPPPPREPMPAGTQSPSPPAASPQDVSGTPAAVAAVLSKCDSEVLYGSRYLACHVTASWAQSAELCGELLPGGRLAAFETQAQLNAVTRAFSAKDLGGLYDFWFGLVSGASTEPWGITRSRGPPLEYVLNDPRVAPTLPAQLWSSGGIGVHSSCLADPHPPPPPAPPAPPSPRPPSPMPPSPPSVPPKAPSPTPPLPPPTSPPSPALSPNAPPIPPSLPPTPPGGRISPPVRRPRPQPPPRSSLPLPLRPPPRPGSPPPPATIPASRPHPRGCCGCLTISDGLALRACQQRIKFICQAPVAADGGLPTPVSGGAAGPGTGATTLLAGLFLEALEDSYRGSYRVFRAQLELWLRGLSYSGLAADRGEGEPMAVAGFENETLRQLAIATRLPPWTFAALGLGPAPGSSSSTGSGSGGPSSSTPTPSLTWGSSSSSISSSAAVAVVVAQLNLTLRGLPRATLTNFSDFLTASLVGRGAAELFSPDYLRLWAVQQRRGGGGGGGAVSYMTTDSPLMSADDGLALRKALTAPSPLPLQSASRLSYPHPSLPLSDLPDAVLNPLSAQPPRPASPQSPASSSSRRLSPLWRQLQQQQQTLTAGPRVGTLRPPVSPGVSRVGEGWGPPSGSRSLLGLDTPARRTPGSSGGNVSPYGSPYGSPYVQGNTNEKLNRAGGGGGKPPFALPPIRPSDSRLADWEAGGLSLRGRTRPDALHVLALGQGLPTTAASASVAVSGMGLAALYDDVSMPNSPSVYRTPFRPPRMDSIRSSG